MKTDVRERLVRAGIVPRGLALDEAAAYVGLSPGTFLQEVKAKKYPDSLPLNSLRRIWDRHALDKAIDRLAGLRAGEAVAAPDNETAMLAAIERAYGASGGIVNGSGQ